MKYQDWTYRSPLPTGILLSLLFLIPHPTELLLAQRAPRLGISADPAVLSVLSASPQGSLDSYFFTAGTGMNFEILVTFDKPVVPLEDLEAQREKIKLVFHPALEGTYKWKGSQTLAFRPHHIPDATEISVTVPRGVRDIDGNTLPSDYTWTFQTKKPALTYSDPYQGSWNILLGQTLRLFFNIPLETADLDRFLSVREKNKTRPLPVTIRPYPVSTNMSTNTARSANDSRLLRTVTTNISTNRFIEIVPEEPFQRNTTYEIVVAKGLRAASGPLGTIKEERILFTTYPPLRYTGPSRISIRPKQSTEIKFSNPVTSSNLLRHMEFKGAHAERSNMSFSWRTWFNPGLDARQSLKIVLSPGITDIYGNTLDNPSEITVTATDYCTYLRTPYSGNGYIESYMAGSFPVHYMNLPSFLFSYKKIGPEDIVPEMRGESGEGETLIIRNNQPDNKEGRTNIPLKDLLGADKGILSYRIRYQYGCPPFPKAHEGSTKGLIQFTELGLTCKFSPFRNLIMTTRLKDARPVAGAEIQIRNEKNETLFTGRTGEDGILSVPGWHRLNLARWKDLYVIATHGDDIAFIRNDMTRGISPFRCMSSFNLEDHYWEEETGSGFSKYYQTSWEHDPETGRYNSWDAEHLDQGLQPPVYDCFLFTERGLYRPGEEVQIKAIAKFFEDNGWRAAAGLSARLTITDPRGLSLLEEDISFGDFGSAHLTLALPETSPTGFYTIRLENEKLKLNASARFQTEEFKSANFEVLPFCGQDSYLAGDIFRGTIKGWYLFGAAMADASYRYTIRLTPSRPDYPAYPGFSFNQFPADGYQHYGPSVLKSGEGILNAEGIAEVEASLLPSRIKYPMRLTLEGSITDQDRQSLSGYLSRELHPTRYYIGLKKESALYPVKEKASFRILTLSPDGSLRSGDRVTVRIQRQEWRNIREIAADGRFHWKSERVVTNVFEKEVPVRNNRDGTEVSFKPGTAGYYQLIAEGRDEKTNTVRNSIWFYVAGAGEASWQAREDDLIELVSEKDRYSPGETLTFMAKSPFGKGRALITVEREGVMESFLEDFNSTSPVFRVPIRQEHAPNIYVSVILLKGRTWWGKGPQEKIGGPAFKIGYLKAAVSAESLKTTVKIEKLKPQYQPGDEVEIELISSRESNEFIVAVVDEGVLNLIDYRIPSPFDFFHQSRPLLVATAESRNYVIEQRDFGRKGENSGGGGGRAKAGLTYRGRFIPTAYYNPSLRSDARGRASVRFKLPDNLTTFRIMIVANTKTGHVGSQNARFLVSKPLLMKEALPQFVRPFDRFKAGVVLHNLTDSEGLVTLRADGERLVRLSPASTNIYFNKGESREIAFEWTTSNTGPVSFRFEAVKGDKTDALQWQIDSLNPKSTEVVALYETTTNDASQQMIVPRDIYPDVGGLTLSAASTGLAGLTGVLEYLRTYPYGCLEQRTSMILPLLLGKKVLLDFGLYPLSGEEMDRRIRDYLGLIPDYQNRYGGFCYWTSRNYASPYLTAYVCLAMIKAREQGFPIDTAVLNRALAYLKSYASRNRFDEEFPYAENPGLLMHAFISYVTALGNKPDQALFTRLYRVRDRVPLFGQAMLLKSAALMGKESEKKNLTRTLMNGLRLESSTAYFEDRDTAWFWQVHESKVRTTAVVLQAFMESGVNFVHFHKVLRWLTEERKHGRYRTTQENAYVFYAMNSYYERYEKETPAFRAVISTAGEPLLEKQFSGRDTRTALREYPLSRFPPGEPLPLAIKKTGKGRLFYGLRMAYAPKKDLTPLNEGMIVERVFLDYTGRNPVSDSFRAGEKYIVELTVRTSAERSFVLLEDQLPAGFQAVNIRLKTSTEEDRTATTSSETGRWWYGVFNHFEFYKDKYLAFADWLPPGVHKVTYVVQAMTTGSFAHPVAKAEEMYNPEVFGRTGQGRITVR